MPPNRIQKKKKKKKPTVNQQTPWSVLRALRSWEASGDICASQSPDRTAGSGVRQRLTDEGDSPCPGISL